MRLQEIQIRIQTLLTQWVGEIEAETNFGQNDKKTISEVVLMSLLREMYGYAQLKTLNADAGFNYPGIDLADEQARVAIQVTATKTSEKISHTLTEFLNHEQYKSYDRLIVYILTEKQQSYSSSDLLAKVDEVKLKQQELGLEQAIFDLERDVWDSRNLQLDIAAMEVEQAERILKILEDNFPQFQTPSLKRWKNLAIPEARFGGQDKLDALVQALLEPVPQPVLVQGLAGIGKSNLCEHGLDHPDVRSRFGARRAFVRCDAATNRENLVAQIALEIGVQVGPDLEPRVFSELEREPCVIVLDNLETPWNADPLPVQELLKVLLGVPGVALVAGVRGGSRPVGPSWFSIQPEALSSEDARALFLAFSEPGFASDPNLTVLVGRLDGLPLAIKLLALLAQGAPNLTGLLREYDLKRSELLNQGPGKGQSLAVSLELSFTSPRMTNEARAGVSVLALLPDGILETDLNDVLEDGHAVARVLRGVGLAFDRDGRVRMLAPVREHFAVAHPISGAGFERVVRFYCALVLQHGRTVGRKDGASAVERLGPEFGNASQMVLLALYVDKSLAVQAAFNLGEFASFTGFEVMRVLTRVLESVPDDVNVPNLIKSLGDIALERSDHDGAQARYEQALLLYRRIGDVQGEANCIRNLGSIALAQSDYDGAQARYEQALPLYLRIGDVLGEANCILCLGSIALAQSDHDGAQARYEQALPLYQSVRDVMGEANCTRGIGDIALERSDHDGAQARYEQALLLYRRIGYVLGEANCIVSLGEIALRRSDHKLARDRFEEALPLFKRVGSVLGEANCILSFGEIELEIRNPVVAQQHFEDALKLYKSIGSWMGQANCVLGFAEIYLLNSDIDGAQLLFSQALRVHREIANFSDEATCLKGLGKIAQQKSLNDEARDFFLEALELYRKISESDSMGKVHYHLSQVARDDTEREHHIAEARRLWASINRQDLIDQHLPPLP